ncbi:hypothetical protein [Streptomyces sp. TRM68367]|nr:hypothetical protein [Streptomyces sp. TRM68367]MBC9723966.1 hypothetical protein [Streptomyces sp. TRM68367]
MARTALPLPPEERTTGTRVRRERLVVAHIDGPLRDDAPTLLLRYRDR